MKTQIPRLLNRGVVELLSISPQSNSQVTVRLKRGDKTEIHAHQNGEFHRAMFEAIDMIVGLDLRPHNISITQMMDFKDEKADNVVCIVVYHNGINYTGTGSVCLSRDDLSLFYAVGEAYVECVNQILGESPISSTPKGAW